MRRPVILFLAALYALLVGHVSDVALAQGQGPATILYPTTPGNCIQTDPTMGAGYLSNSGAPCPVLKDAFYYGAKCDADANDTAAFQAYIDAAGPGVVEVPAKRTCVVSSLNLPSGTYLRGGGMGSSVLKLGSNIGSGGAAGMLTLASASHVTISDLTLDGNRSTFSSTNNNAIYGPASGSGLSDIAIDRVEVKSPAGACALILGPSSAVRDSRIAVRSSYLHDCGYHGVITQGYVDHVSYSHNQVFNWGELVANSVGLVCGRYATDCLIDGNQVSGDLVNETGPSSHGISLDNCANGNVINNYVTSTIGYGIEVGECSGVTVGHNVIIGTTRSGISVDGSGTGSSVADGVTTANSTAITSATANFFPGMKGKGIAASGCQANGGTEVTWVTAFNSPTSISVFTPCANSQTGVTLTWPATNSNVTVVGNSLQSAGTLAPSAAVYSVINGPVSKYVNATDVTCTSGSTTIASPTVPFASWMVGQGGTFTGCAAGPGTLTAVIAAIIDAHDVRISKAATATNSGGSTMNISTPYSLNNRVSIVGNVESAAAGLGYFINNAEYVTLQGNVAMDNPQSGIELANSNYVSVASNTAELNNTSLTAGQAGIVALMTTSIGSVLTAYGNQSLANGDGTGGAADEIYDLDSLPSNFNFDPIQIANSLIPNTPNTGALGTTSNPWSLVIAGTNASAAVPQGARRASTIFVDSALSPITLATASNASLGAYGSLVPLGEFVIYDVNGAFCKFFLRGPSNATIKEYDAGTDGGCSVTKGNASTTNVYYDAAGSSGAGYYIENQIGSTRTYYVITQGT